MTNLNASEIVRAKASTGKSLKEIATGRSDMFRINPYNLTMKDGWNSRDPNAIENREHIENLAKSIAIHGVMEPLTAHNDGGTLIITDGHCRLLATYLAIETMGAEIFSVPVKTEPKGSSEADRLLSQIIRNSGKQLTALELATVCKRLQGYGWTLEQIAEKAAISLVKVNQLLDLHAAPDQVKTLINEGKVSPTLAMTVIKKDGDEKAVKTLTDAVAVAEKAGKTKATAKDTGAQSIRKLMVEAFDNAHVDDADEFDDRVQVLIRRSDWEKIVQELKL